MKNTAFAMLLGAFLLMVNMGAATLSLVLWRLIAHRMNFLKRRPSPDNICFAVRSGPRSACRRLRVYCTCLFAS